MAKKSQAKEEKNFTESAVDQVAEELKDNLESNIKFQAIIEELEREPKVALPDPDEEPKGKVVFGDRPDEESDTKPGEEVEPDERFQKSAETEKEKEKEYKNMKRRMSKEQAKDKRINLKARMRRFWVGDIDTEGWTIQKAVRLFSIITAYLLNLFTIVVIVYLILDVVTLFRGDLNNYFQALKIGLEGAFIWMVVKIHEKIEV